jgi:hypothetical protein
MASGEFRKIGLLEKDFSRHRILPLRVMLTLLLYMIADAGRRGYKCILDQFWADCRKCGIDLGSEWPVTPAAFCKARMKIPSEMILALVHVAAEQFDQHFGHDFRLKGHRVFAVDGTKTQVTRSDDLFDALGWHASGYNPQMLVSTLYDVLSKVPHDLRVAATHSSERDELREMLDALHDGDILTLDRGYPSFELLTELGNRNLHFVIRVPSSTFAAVVRFVADGGSDGWVTVSPPSRLRSTQEPRKVRVVVLPVDDDKPVVLITSLDESEFPWLEMGDLYHMRWETEELYKLEKGDYLGQKQYHAKSLEGLKQEVYGLALFISITRAFTAAAADVSGTPYRHLYQKTAVLAAADCITQLLLEERTNEFNEVVQHLIARIARDIEPPRPGRSYPRRSYRPRPRWTPTGKRGRK